MATTLTMASATTIFDDVENRSARADVDDGEDVDAHEGNVVDVDDVDDVGDDESGDNEYDNDVDGEHEGVDAHDADDVYALFDDAGDGDDDDIDGHR